MKFYKFCKSNFLLLLVVFMFALAFAPADAFPQNRPRSCPGTNPTVKEAKVDVTKLGGIDIQPCDGQPVTLRGALLNGSGTVTQVQLAMPSNLFSVSGSPIVSAGTLTTTLKSQTANTFFAAPNGADGSPNFRGILPADVPPLDASKINNGIFDPARMPGLSGAKITSGTVGAAFIDNLDAAKTTTGVFNPARLGSGTPDATKFLRGDSTFSPLAASDVPAHPATLLTSGTVDPARLGSGTPDGTKFLRGNSTYSGLTASDVPPLDASKTTTGVFAPARLGSGTANGTTFLAGDGVFKSVTVNNKKTIQAVGVNVGAGSTVNLTNADSGTFFNSSGYIVGLPPAPDIGFYVDFFEAGNGGGTVVKLNGSSGTVDSPDGLQSGYGGANARWTLSASSTFRITFTGNRWVVTNKIGTITLTN